MKKTKRFLFLLLALAVLLSGNCFASDQGTRPYNRYAEVEEIIDGERAEDPDDWVLTSHNHHFKWWFGITPQRALILLA